MIKHNPTNIYSVIEKLDEALARTHAFILSHKEIESKKGKKVLWDALRRSALEADSHMLDLMKVAKHPFIDKWDERRGYPK